MWNWEVQEEEGAVYMQAWPLVNYLLPLGISYEMIFDGVISGFLLFGPIPHFFLIVEPLDNAGKLLSAIPITYPSTSIFVSTLTLFTNARTKMRIEMNYLL